MTVGRANENWCDEVEDLYKDKISKLIPFELIHLKGSRYPRSQAVEKRKADSDIILKHLKKDDIVILCDEKGQELDTLKAAKKIKQLQQATSARLVVVLGGPFGVTKEVMDRAHWKWSLSSLTFSHLVAVAVVLEQLYRVATIWKNIPYHNA